MESIFAKLLDFWMGHTLGFITVSVSLVFATIGLYFLVNIRRENRENPDLKEIEETLRKVLGSTGGNKDKTAKELVDHIEDSLAADLDLPPVDGKSTSGVVSPPSHAGTPTASSSVAPSGGAKASGSSAEVEKASAELVAKNKKLEELQAALSVAQEEVKKAKEKGGDASNAESGDLKKKVEELENRLAEYAIIEDDIANLNIYKEENSRLKDEIEKIKANSGSVATPASIPPPSPAPAPVAAPDPVASPNLNASEVPISKSMSQSDIDKMMGLEEVVPPIPAVPAAVSVPVATPVTATEVDKTAMSQSEIENLMGLASTPFKSEDGDTLSKELGELLAKEKVAGPEASDLAAQPAAPIVEKMVDPDKLVAEFDALLANPPEVKPDDGKDPADKLVEEFENFLNNKAGGPS